ncbi:MAG: hypothetical protein JNK87_09970 [Bryobacterales bacterium]|nr:hypothetical protein [Bryobacterales bacterium]
MKYLPGVVLACVVVGDVLFAALLWQFLQRRNSLGKLLWEAPRARSWLTIFWLVYGAGNVANALYRGPGLDPADPLDHAFDYGFGGTLVAISLSSLLLTRGLRVYEAGIIHSFLVMPWKDIRGWAWEDHGPPAGRELYLWSGAAWRWYLTLRSKSPVKTSTAYDDQLDGLLQHYAPTATTATRT